MYTVLPGPKFPTMTRTRVVRQRRKIAVRGIAAELDKVTDHVFDVGS